MDRVPKAHGVDFKVWADRLAVIMMLMVLAWCLAGLMMPARAQSDPGATPVVVYTVQPGDTLWGYAARITPDGGNVADTVDELVRLNNLDSVSLRAGQRLIRSRRGMNPRKIGLVQWFRLFLTPCIALFVRIQIPRWSIPASAMTAIPSAVGVNARNAPSVSPR